MLQDREQLGAHEQTRSKCRHSVCAIECAVRVPVSAIPGMHYMGTCSLTMHTHLRTCTPAYAARTTQYRWASDASVGRGVAHAAEYTSHARAGGTLDAQNGPVPVVCASCVSSRNEHADKHTQCLAPLRATAAAALPFFGAAHTCYCTSCKHSMPVFCTPLFVRRVLCGFLRVPLLFSV